MYAEKVNVQNNVFSLALTVGKYINLKMCFFFFAPPCIGEIHINIIGFAKM